MDKNTYTLSDATGAPRTRGEEVTETSVTDTVTMITNYISRLWAEISERLQDSDLDGTTCWSEAPAESVFITRGLKLDHRPSLSVSHAEMLCRLVRDGPKVGTKESDCIQR